MRLTFTIILLALSSIAGAQTEAEKLNEAIQQFDQGYYPLNLPGLALDFKTNLSNELEANNTAQQKAFFEDMQAKLQGIDPRQLTKAEFIDLEILRFECSVNLEKLSLIERTTQSETADLNRIYDFENGPAWYAWFIKKWTGSDLSPEQIMNFGKTEVARIKKAISELDLPAQKPDSFYTRDKSLIVETLQAKRNHISQQLGRLLPDFEQLPALNITQGTNRQLAQAPGYYNNNTFYFNLFDEPFDLADCDWLLIHEGNPGHHFQVSYHAAQARKPYRRGLRNMGFIEGWAAYTENLGWEMALYKDDFEALGKWNWDMIRSVRVVLDVAINYLGWTDEQCLKYWRDHISGKDDIAAREIARMKRWPAQVLTYKLGEAEIFKAKKKAMQQLGVDFNLKQFHTEILAHGPVPVKLISQLNN